MGDVLAQADKALYGRKAAGPDGAIRSTATRLQQLFGGGRNTLGDAGCGNLAERVRATSAELAPYLVFISGGTHPFTSYRAVSEAYRGTIACLGPGVSETPSCMVLNEAGRPVATVGYNGRIFRISEQGEIDYEHPLFEPIG